MSPCRNIRVLPVVLLAGVGASIAQQPNPTAHVDQASARAILTEARQVAENLSEKYDRLDLLDAIGAEEAKAGDLEAAIDIKNELGYGMNRSTEESLGHLLGDADDLTSIRAALSRLTIHDDLLYMDLASRLAERGKVAEALQICSDIHVGDYRRNSLEDIAVKQVELGDETSAQNTMKWAQQSSSAYRVGADDLKEMIARGRILRGDVPGAYQSVESIGSKRSRAAALLGLARLLWKRSDAADAKVWMDEAIRLLDNGPRGWTPLGGVNDWNYQHEFAIPLQVRLGQKEEALHYIDQLKGSRQLHSLNVLVLSCVAAGDMPCVDSLVERIRLLPPSKYEGVEETEKDVVIDNISSALADKHEFDRALKLFPDKEVGPPQTWISFVPGYVGYLSEKRAIIQARQGEFDLAQATLGSTSDSRLHTRAVHSIAFLETRALGAEQSLQWVKTLTDPKERGYALVGITQALLGEEEYRLEERLIGGWTISDDEHGDFVGEIE